MQKHIKTHKTWQSCCSLDLLASKSEGPSGHGDAGTLAPQGHLETRSTVSRTWICLPALQKYVHTSISTIMLCIYIYIYYYYIYIYIFILPTYLVLSQVSSIIQFSGKNWCSHDVSQVKSRFWHCISSHSNRWKWPRMSPPKEEMESILF